MKLTITDPPRLDRKPEVAVRQTSEWVRQQLRRLTDLLNGRVLPEDQFDAEEVEVTFAAVPGTQSVSHTLARSPIRVEVVRAGVGGVVYTTAQTTTTVTIATTAVGTYRIRIS